MSESFDAVIVGAGAVGASAALALAAGGLRVALVEASAPKAFDTAHDDLRVFALSPASMAILTRLGVWPAIAAARISPYRRMRVWQDRPERELYFDATLIGAETLGAIVEDGILRDQLWQAVANTPAIKVCCPARISTLQQQHQQLLLDLDDGRQLRAALAIAADGAASRLRELAGIATSAHDYATRAVVAHVRHRDHHQFTAWQRFTPEGPLAFLPLSDGRSSIVWSLPESVAQRILQLDEPSFCAELTTAFQSRLGEVSACSARASFPLRLQLAQRYAAERVVLIGDAAHTVHPLAGQGLNLGLLDAAALSDVLRVGAGTLPDCGAPELLRRYSDWRSSDAGLAAHSFDALHRLFRQPGEGWAWLRRTGLGLVDAIAPLKREFALQASGFAGRVPRLARRL